MIQDANILCPGGRTNLGIGIRLRIKPAQGVYVELVRPGNSPRVHREVVERRVEIL